MSVHQSVLRLIYPKAFTKSVFSMIRLESSVLLYTVDRDLVVGAVAGELRGYRHAMKNRNWLSLFSCLLA